MLSDYNWIQTHNHLVHKRTLNHSTNSQQTLDHTTKTQQTLEHLTNTQ